MHSEKVKHRTKPSEPWGQPGAIGKVTRVTPAYRSIPAMAHVEWDGYSTWERLADLVEIGKGR